MTSLALILAVVVAPLLLYRAVDFSPPAAYAAYTGGGFTSDFSSAKAFVIVAAGLAAMAGLWGAKIPRAALLIAAPLALLAMVSTALSPHSGILFGAPGLSEGALVVTAYMFLMLAASAADHWRLVLRLLVITALLVAGLGFAEHLGYPYLFWAPHWLTGLDMPASRASNAFVASTMGNSNHLGSYCALVLPIFVTLSRRRVAFAVLSVVVAALLASSHSRGGAMGAFVGCLFGLWRGR